MSIICAICNKKQSGWIEDYPLSNDMHHKRICVNCHDKLYKLSISKTPEKETGIIESLEGYLSTIEDDEVKAVLESIIGHSKNNEQIRAEKELEKQKKEEEEAEEARLNYFDYSIHGENPLYELKGNRGRRLTIYPHKCVIKTDVTLGSVVAKNATDGEKTIYFKDVIGVQFKKPGLSIGYLQLETSSMQGNNLASNFFNENTFTYDVYNNEIYEVYKYIITKLDNIKKI